MSFQKVLVLCILTTSHYTYFVEGQSSTKTAKNYVAESLISPSTVQYPRGIVQDESGDILVVSKETSQIFSIYQDGNTVKSVLIIDDRTLRLNHGIAYDKGYLYASNNNSVLRWSYEPARRARILSPPEIVVNNIPGGGDHLTRTIITDKVGFLYVTVGSASNVDKDSSRSLIRRFSLAGLPSDFKDGELFVDGVRNTVGLAVDAKNHVWGVDCGADELVREDLGGDIHNTNPADKLIQFSKDASYGYPYCFTIDKLDGYTRGQQMAWPTFMNDGKHTDAWCQNPANSRPPTLTLPAHNAPLGLAIYDGASCDSSSDAFPCSMKGDIFVALHGSWDREPPAGYKVVRIPIDPKTNLPTGEIQDIIYEINKNSCVMEPSKCFRPVDLVFDQKTGHLIVTSDTSNEIIKIRYKENNSKVDLKKIIMAIVGIVFIALFTGIVIGLIAHKYCYLCCASKDVPYHREDI